MKKWWLTTCLVVLCTMLAHADPITYTFSFGSQGNLNSVPFGVSAVVIQFTGDTANLYMSNGAYHNDIGTATISISGGTPILFTDPIVFGANPTYGDVGLDDSFYANFYFGSLLVDTDIYLLQGYTGATAIAPTFGYGGANGYLAYGTAAGRLNLFGGGGGFSTFSATVGTAVTPEPSPFLLLASGLIFALVITIDKQQLRGKRV